MAEASRESTANALHLHVSHPSNTKEEEEEEEEEEDSIGNYMGLGESNITAGLSQYYCSSLLEALPLPEPTWSTTAPSVLAIPAPAPPLMAPLEFEWVENLASSHAWWLGFLQSLNSGGDSNGINEVSAYPFEEEESMIMGFERDPYDSELGETPLNEIDLSLDEWLIIPSSEDQGESG